MPINPGPPEEFNPYGAPQADLAPAHEVHPEFGEIEAIRRKYLSHEASVKSIGSLYYLSGILLIMGCIALGYSIAANQLNMAGTFVFVLVIYVGLAVLNFSLGYGLTHLKTWARWVAVVFGCLYFVIAFVQLILSGQSGPEQAGAAFAGLLIPGLIVSYVLYLLVSAKGSYVFSASYQEIIRLTPHIKYKSGCLVKFLLALVISVICVGVLGFLIGGRR